MGVAVGAGVGVVFGDGASDAALGPGAAPGVVVPPAVVSSLGIGDGDVEPAIVDPSGSRPGPCTSDSTAPVGPGRGRTATIASTAAAARSIADAGSRRSRERRSAIVWAWSGVAGRRDATTILVGTVGIGPEPAPGVWVPRRSSRRLRAIR